MRAQLAGDAAALRCLRTRLSLELAALEQAKGNTAGRRASQRSTGAAAVSPMEERPSQVVVCYCFASAWTCPLG